MAVVTLLVVSSELILRDVQRDDVELYVRMRCDPVMMQELGGPRSPHDMAEKVRLDAAAAQAGSSWILMVVPDRARTDGRWGVVHAYPAVTNEPSIDTAGCP